MKVNMRDPCGDRYVLSMNANILVVIDWTAPPPTKFICWSFNPSSSECNHIWKLSLWRGTKVEMRSLGWILFQYGWFPHRKKGNWNIDTYRRKTLWRQREKIAIYKQRETIPVNTLRCSAHLNFSLWGQETWKKPTLWTTWSQTSSFRKYEEVNFCFLNPSVTYRTLLWQP